MHGTDLRRLPQQQQEQKQQEQEEPPPNLLAIDTEDQVLFLFFTPHQVGLSESLIRSRGGQMAHQIKSTI